MHGNMNVKLVLFGGSRFRVLNTVYNFQQNFFFYEFLQSVYNGVYSLQVKKLYNM
jgi:hypothetical protein